MQQLVQLAETAGVAVLSVMMQQREFRQRILDLKRQMEEVVRRRRKSGAIQVAPRSARRWKK